MSTPVLEKFAISEVLFRYASTLDTFELDAWAACFTEDAVFRVAAVDGSVSETVGRARLREALAAMRSFPSGKWRHLTTGTQIDLAVSGVTATALSYWISIDNGGAGASPRVLAFGTYTDELRRQPAGEWLIATRVVDMEGAPH